MPREPVRTFEEWLASHPETVRKVLGQRTVPRAEYDELMRETADLSNAMAAGPEGRKT